MLLPKNECLKKKIGGKEIRQHMMIQIFSSSSSFVFREEETNFFLVQKPKEEEEKIGLENSIRSHCLHSFFVCVHRDCRCTRARPRTLNEEEKEHFFFCCCCCRFYTHVIYTIMSSAEKTNDDDATNVLDASIISGEEWFQKVFKTKLDEMMENAPKDFEIKEDTGDEGGFFKSAGDYVDKGKLEKEYYAKQRLDIVNECHEQLKQQE